MAGITTAGPAKMARIMAAMGGRLDLRGVTRNTGLGPGRGNSAVIGGQRRSAKTISIGVAMATGAAGDMFAQNPREGGEAELVMTGDAIATGSWSSLSQIDRGIIGQFVIRPVMMGMAVEVGGMAGITCALGYGVSPTVGSRGGNQRQTVGGMAGGAPVMDLVITAGDRDATGYGGSSGMAGDTGSKPINGANMEAQGTGGGSQCVQGFPGGALMAIDTSYIGRVAIGTGVPGQGQTDPGAVGDVMAGGANIGSMYLACAIKRRTGGSTGRRGSGAVIMTNRACRSCVNGIAGQLMVQVVDEVGVVTGYAVTTGRSHVRGQSVSGLQ